MRSKLGPALMFGALLFAACSSPKSIILLTLQSADATPITGVTEVVVDVTQFGKMATLTYPPPAGKTSITIDQTNTTDLTVSFSGGQSGTVDLAVTAKDANGCLIGFGQVATLLRQGSVVTALALMMTEMDCSTADGGTGPDGSTTTFPGCDPVAPMCDTGDTCQVNCMKHIGECTLGGTGAAGSLCNTNADCAAGTQCFDYTSTGCGVKVCLKFCADDKGCGTTSTTTSALSTPADGGSADTGSAEGGAGANAAADGSTDAASSGAVATQSLCAGPVQCGSVVTAYHTCTFACDPRLVSVKSGSRCPTGLSCLVVLGMDQVDCACPESTRIGTDGDSCTGSAQCAPGYVCNIMGNTQQCRAVCSCNASGMTCTAPNDCANGKSCQTLTKDTVFGVCL